MHDMRSLARKKCSMSQSTVLVPVLAIQMATFECSSSSRVAAYHGEGASLFRPCEKTVAHGFVLACFTLANIAKPEPLEAICG